MELRKDFPACIVCNAYLTGAEFGLYCTICRDIISESVDEKDQLVSIKNYEEGDSV